MIRQLVTLKNEVIENKFNVGETKLFAGAGLVIEYDGTAASSENYTLITTEYALELSSLIFRLRDIFDGYIDYLSKYAFYDTLGQAAIRSLEKQSNMKNLLLDVIDEALCFTESFNETIEYFAYGSNMDETQMSKRCPSAKVIGKGMLPGYCFSLDHSGYATVLNRSNDSVLGVIWEIRGTDVIALDKAEGVRKECYRDAFVRVEEIDKVHDVLIYISLREANDGNRKDGYLKKVIRAANRWEFPVNYVNHIKQLL